MCLSTAVTVLDIRIETVDRLHSLKSLMSYTLFGILDYNARRKYQECKLIHCNFP